MVLNFRFVVVSDLYIVVFYIIFEKIYSFYLVEVSIFVLELVLEYLSKLDIDFLLLFGDLI